jgi:hypothetical protein
VKRSTAIVVRRGPEEDPLPRARPIEAVFEPPRMLAGQPPTTMARAVGSPSGASITPATAAFVAVGGLLVGAVAGWAVAEAVRR